MATAAVPTADAVEVEPLISAEEIAKRVGELADTLAATLPRDVVVLSLLKGSFMFAADLVRAMHVRGMRCQVEFLKVSSYGNTTESSGRIAVQGDVPGDLHGKAVLLLDDILDTGRTLEWARGAVSGVGAESVTICALLDKPSRREVEIEADLVGFKIPDQFVVGYGVDYAQRFRDLPYIGVLRE